MSYLQLGKEQDESFIFIATVDHGGQQSFQRHLLQIVRHCMQLGLLRDKRRMCLKISTNENKPAYS